MQRFSVKKTNFNGELIMGKTKIDIQKRHDFIAKLAQEGCSLEEAMAKYDAKFGTNYSQSLHKDTIGDGQK
jgi:hypothetical protein